MVGTKAQSEQLNRAISRTDLIAHIKDAYETLSLAERSVANVVLSDVHFAVRAANTEIAKRAGVSQPTVTRFCRSIGCDGVRDFKLALAQSLAVGDAYFIEEQEARVGEIPQYWDSVLREARAALREVERQLSPQHVLPAAELLAEARRIAVFGVGGSASTLAHEAQVRLFRFGRSVEVCQESYVARMTAATLKPGDVFLVISASGHTPEVIEAMEIALTYGAKVIAITQPMTPIAKTASIPLAVRVEEHLDALTPTASRFAFLSILDLLAAGVAYRLGAEARESLRRIKFNIMRDESENGIEPLGD